jgi:outer membrane biosynthesis protein TonB
MGIMTPTQEKPQEKKIKVSLKEMPKKAKPVEKVENSLQQPLDIAPPMPKGSQLKELANSPIKYDLAKTKEPKLPKKTPEIIQKSEPLQSFTKPKTEPIPPKEPYIKLPQEKKDNNLKDKKDDNFSWMNEDKSDQEAKKDETKNKGRSSINSDLKELYGDEFGKFTPGQQKYLIDNQEIMRRITQEVLNRVAQVNLRGDINANKTNIVEFYLHPNGDMSDFKFLKNSGHYILDDTTKETIEYAYSRYPRPSEKILIRYNVFYNLARY